MVLHGMEWDVLSMRYGMAWQWFYKQMDIGMQYCPVHALTVPFVRQRHIHMRRFLLHVENPFTGGGPGHMCRSRLHVEAPSTHDGPVHICKLRCYVYRWRSCPCVEDPFICRVAAHSHLHILFTRLHNIHSPHRSQVHTPFTSSHLVHTYTPCSQVQHLPQDKRMI